MRCSLMQSGATMKTVRTTVTLPAEQHERLQRLADSKGLSLAWVVREAVGQFLGKHGEDAEFDPLSPGSQANRKDA